MIMDVKRVSDCITNTQLDTIIHSKTQTDIHRQEQQLNKEVPKKFMIQQILFQSYLHQSLFPKKIAFTSPSTE